MDCLPGHLDAKPGNRLGIYKSENNTLQNITLGLDPSTGFGQLIGEIAEIMIFDRNLQPIEKEKIEGYLAHKWGVIDDLTQSGFKVRNELVLYYPFNETDGSIVQDYSTSLRDATVVDAALDTVGKFGSGICFLPIWNRLKFYYLKVITFLGITRTGQYQLGFQPRFQLLVLKIFMHSSMNI